MTPRPISDQVIRVLEESQRLGFVGDRPIPEVVEHARCFVAALESVSGTVVDLGSGGGVPGLVIAHDRPDLDVVLVDRRSKRIDFLSRMVLRLGWSDHVAALDDDVRHLIARSPDAFDAAVARGFGPPEMTLRLASQLVRPGGRVVISEPPSGERWVPEVVSELGVRRVDEDLKSVAVFERPGFT